MAGRQESHSCDVAMRKSGPSSARAKSPGRAERPGGRAKSPGRGRDRDQTEKPMTKKFKRWHANNDASDDEDGDGEDTMMPAVMQRKVMEQARAQQDEMEAQQATRSSRAGTAFSRPGSAPAHGSGIRPDNIGDDFEDDGEDDGSADDEKDAAELAEAGEYYEDVEELELDENDERALDLMMGGVAPTRTLADIIMEKINERSAAMTEEGGGPSGEAEVAEAPSLPPKVIEVYESVGTMLSRYRSGKLPTLAQAQPE